MTKRFTNVYDDRERARAYAVLQFPGTCYLAFRDIPLLLATGDAEAVPVQAVR